MTATQNFIDQIKGQNGEVEQGELDLNSLVGANLVEVGPALKMAFLDEDTDEVVTHDFENCGGCTMYATDGWVLVRGPFKYTDLGIEETDG